MNNKIAIILIGCLINNLNIIYTVPKKNSISSLIRHISKHTSRGTDNQGNNSYHIVCKYADIKVLKILFQHRVSGLNMKNKLGKTPADITKNLLEENLYALHNASEENKKSLNNKIEQIVDAQDILLKKLNIS